MIIPIFRIFNIEKAKSFYLDFLGFNLDWEHQFDKNMPFYYQISYLDDVIHLSEHHGDSTPGSTIRLKIKDLHKYHLFLLEKKYSFANPKIIKTPWNTIELTIIDPFSNRIIFYEEIE